MAVGDNVGINPGAGAQITADRVDRGEGFSYTQFVKLLDGRDGGVNPLHVDAAGAIAVTETGLTVSADSKLLALTPRNGGLANSAVGAWTLAAVGSSTMVGRKDLLIWNDSDVRIRVAFSASKPLQDGIPVPSGQSYSLHGSMPVYVQPEVGGVATTKNVIVAEGA